MKPRMNWTELIADLKEAGVTQTEIATQCGVTQSSVSELSRGHIESPSFDFGTRLVALHKTRTNRKRREPLGQRG